MMYRIQTPTEKENKWLKSVEQLSKIFSTCSRRQYASIVVASNGRVVGMGYNGAPAGFKHCTDGGCPRAFTDVEHGSVYDNCVAIHAEANAILWSDASARQGGTLFVNGPPCFGCAKLIANSGISKVVFYPDEEYANIADILIFLNKAKIKIAIGER